MAVVLALLRLGVVGQGARVDATDDVLPLLLAIGLLCVVGLARRTHRSAAWLATIGASFILTIDVATYAREVRSAVEDDDVAWRWLGIAVSLSATLTVASAAAYAFSRPRFKAGRLGVHATIVVASLIAAIALWAVANPTDATFIGRTASGLGSLGLVTRTFLLLTPLLTAIGIFGDVLPAAERARRRVALTHRGPASLGGRGQAWLLAFVDELAPGRARARRAVLAERTRVARDIHADVVPGLRQALAAAERGASPDELATSLRDVLVDVEGGGQAPHPIQLEIGGLVAALEWLAERVERQSSARITLAVEGPPLAGPGEPPPDVAATAFRVAALALNNAVRHASASDPVITVRPGASVVEVVVADDRPGITAEALAAARENGRRGLADMAAEAAAIGATVDVGPGPGGRGTVVSFSWRGSDGA